MSHYTDFYDRQYSERQNVYSIDLLKRTYIIELDYYMSKDFKDYFNYNKELFLNKFLNSIQLTEEEDIYFNYLKIENLRDYISFEIEKQPVTININYVFYLNKQNKKINFISKELDQYGGLENFINKRKLQEKINNF